MKRTHVHRMVAVALGLVILGFAGFMSVAVTQSQSPVTFAERQWVLLYRLNRDLYIIEDATPKLLVSNVPLSDLAILQMAMPERFQRVPVTPRYEFHTALPSPADHAFVYLERVDLGQDFNLWLVQDDGQRKLLLSQRYQDGTPSMGYMVPVAWSGDNTILLHETLIEKPVALWQLSLSDLSLQRLGEPKEFYSPDMSLAVSVQPTTSAQMLMLLKNLRTSSTREVIVSAQKEQLEIVGWAEASMIPTTVSSLQQRITGLLTNPFLYWPLPGNYRNNTCGFGCYSGHGGIDVDTDTYPSLTPIYAAAHGWVEAVERSKTDGMNRNPSDGFANYVKIRHDNGYYTIYAHMQPNSARVSPGQEVWPGTPLGNASNSGMTCGNDPANSGCYGFRGSFYHLHFEVRSCSTSSCAVNPFGPYIWIGNPPSVPGGPPEPTPTPRPNRPPNTPSPQSPGDWHVARDGRAPALCWNNPGDPDGDPVQFYAEVYESAVNANSGWQNGTCWRPGSLDGRYYNYQWRVKAKDSRGAESGWSTTWHFSIEAPNQPPSISFLTANGNGDSQITSRERNWTFAGTASDPEGRLDRIEFRCDDCDNRGNGPDRTTGNNWSLARTDMAGQNDVYFVAFDDRQSTSSRHLLLRIDLAAPATTLSLNNEANPDRWPAWFTDPVTVRLHADDSNTGRARSGVREVRYRCTGPGCPNAGNWQAVGGSDAAFTVSADGAYTVEYYAVDHVGNQEGTRSVSFRVDRTPPTPPSGVAETHGVVNDQWQKAINTPTFTWAASTDATSGLWGYQFYFGPDPNGVAYQTFLADAPRQWTPLPGGVRTGTYYLRARTRDNAGNWSNWVTLFTFRYDGTPPENPREITHAIGIANDTWQRTTSLADFTWPVPHDEGSGVKGYFLYWGPDPDGSSTTFNSNNRYQSSTPLCGTNEACSGYLRLRSRDNVDNDAENWSTVFVLRYDDAPPVADFTFNGGVTQTTQTRVTLHIVASDQGSGVRDMRLSSDGQNWTPWEVFAVERPWEIPGISRQWWPVYLQVRDGMGLVSGIISHTIYLDVNPRQPRSASFRLFDYALSAGTGEHTSGPTGYQGRSTLGQVVDSAAVNSLNYRITGGYQAGSQAIPVVEPGHDEFTFINGTFASGTGADTMRSSLFAMRGTFGEPGLPNNTTTLQSRSHQLQPGFLAAALPIPAPTPTPTPGPTPTPEPPPACEFPRISINNAALFTNDPQVTLSICAPRAVEMMLSNDGGFPGATWEPYAETKPWTLTTYGQYVLPRFVYAAFKDRDGTVHGVYFDDIIYDPNPPEGTIAVDDSVLASGGAEEQRGKGAEEQGSERAEVLSWESVKYVQRLGNIVLAHPVALVGANANGTVDVYVNARDDNSGLAEMQISASATFTDTTWETYSALKPWTPEGGDGVKTVYARFRDAAGNVSAPAEASFALDTQPPFGGIALEHRVVGPDVVTTTVYLGANDNLSGVTDLRIGEQPDFSDAVWQPYTMSLTWPISYTVESEKTVYVQYRDLAGNVSEVYSDTYLVDIAPPVVYVEVEPGSTPTRTVHIYVYDGLVGESAGVALLRLTNDPFFIEGMVTVPYTDTVQWTFDDRRVVWVQAKDSVGNWSEPYPAFAGPACPEDLVGYDGVITAADIQAVAVLWREPVGWPYDRDGDGVITVADIMWYAARWGRGCDQITP